LCYLAAEGRRRHPRRELAELLWPQSDERHARTDLRSALARLRKTLGEDTTTFHGQEEVRFLLIERDILGLDMGGIDLDVEALQAALWLARSETSLPGGGRALGRRELISRLEGAVGLYRGEFMEGFSVEDANEFELWVEGERTRWRGVFGELCEKLSRLEVEGGQLEEAIGTARVWVRQAPLGRVRTGGSWSYSPVQVRAREHFWSTRISGVP